MGIWPMAPLLFLRLIIAEPYIFVNRQYKENKAEKIQPNYLK